ncbi:MULTISPECIES: integrase [Lactobacillus]|uniref:Integrase n=1 Tax=Lactobacillus xujianguonis TaxID=2495899 RepID=A0A437SSA2_9LACO|nr:MULTISPECIES: integrase [Lactobacillus]RVU69821.1 integrase [Lactobacillus xujianguonis]RVU73432.1 integrase [Lactobacillus xujianguonis]
MERVYAMYRGDEFVDVGTIKELAKKYNRSPVTIKKRATPAAHRKDKDHSLLLYKLDDEDNV